MRNGRNKEFAEDYAKHGGTDIPDPLAQATRDLAVLDWAAIDMSPHRERFALTRALLAVRREHIVPLVPQMRGGADARIDNDVLVAEWRAGGKRLQIVANLSGNPKPRPILSWGMPIWGEVPPQELRRWTVYAAIGGE